MRPVSQNRSKIHKGPYSNQTGVINPEFSASLTKSPITIQIPNKISCKNISGGPIRVWPVMNSHNIMVDTAAAPTSRRLRPPVYIAKLSLGTRAVRDG